MRHQKYSHAGFLSLTGLLFVFVGFLVFSNVQLLAPQTIHAEGELCGPGQTSSNACGGGYFFRIRGGRCAGAFEGSTMPSNYGASCTSGGTDACGTHYGTINCSGTCSPSGASSCYVQNACGNGAYGSYCGSGSCNASPPALPAGYGTSCSVSNSCGSRTNYGTINCNGVCSASAPSEGGCASPPTVGGFCVGGGVINTTIGYSFGTNNATRTESQACLLPPSAGQCSFGTQNYEYASGANGAYCNMNSSSPNYYQNQGASVSGGGSTGSGYYNTVWSTGSSLQATWLVPPEQAGCNWVHRIRACNSSGTCSSWSRVSTGQYTSSGTTQYPSCGYNPNGSSCNTPAGWNPSSINDGAAITAYQASSVTSPSACTSQTRTCTNGTLSGSYQYQSCTVVETCGNGATNPAACNQCGTGQAYSGGSCSACSNGGCTGLGGSSSDPDGGLTCNNGSTAVPSCTLPSATLSASPSTIDSGQSSTLTWSSAGATSCTNAAGEGVGGFSTGGATSGSDSVGALTQTASYQVTCVGAGGSVNAPATVTVNTPQASLTATPSRVRSGESSTITWSASQVTSCSVSGPGVSASGLTGSRTVAITQQSTYTLTCQTLGSPLVKTATVNIIPAFQEF